MLMTIQNLDNSPDTHIQILESNKWQAVRYGLEGTFIDPLTLKQLPINKAIEGLCNLIEPAMVSLGSSKYIRNIEEILIHGTGASQKRDIFKKSGKFEDVIKSMKERFYQ